MRQGQQQRRQRTKGTLKFSKETGFMRPQALLLLSAVTFSVQYFVSPTFEHDFRALTPLPR